ncbi:MAG: HEAT repeat domain-containing protein, partial [Phycisphaerae bacterium]|nr:HEAT repeat domain-containing protein [Phycisphaerae bacterium]
MAPSAPATQPGDDAHISKLVQRLKNENEAVWKPAAEELVKIGPEVAEAVAELFNSAPGDSHAVQVLQKLAKHPRVQEVMVKGLSSRNSNVVHCSLIVLGKSGNRKHVKAIAPLLKSSTIAASIALQQLGGDEAFKALVAGLNQKQVEFRWLVAESLAKMGRPEAIPHLKKVLKRMDAKTLGTAHRIVAAIHKIERKSGTSSDATGLYGFWLHAVGDRNWRLLDLYDLDRMNVQYVQPFRPAGTENQTRLKAFKALAAKESGHLAWDTHGGGRLLAFHGLKLAPLTLKIPPNYTLWGDVHRFFHQRELAKQAEAYKQFTNILLPAKGMRAYSFKEGDQFIALLPDGRVFFIKAKLIRNSAHRGVRHSTLHLTAMPLDPLYALIPPEAYRVITKPPATQPVGSKLEFRVAPYHPETGKKPTISKAELKWYLDILRKGLIGRWWVGKRITITGPLPDHIWLPIAGELTNAPVLVTGEYKGQKYVLVSDMPGQTMLPAKGKNAWGLAKVYATKDSLGRPAVGFELDERGAELFAAFTKANINNVLAIVVDGKVVSAPLLRSTMGKQGIIVGQFSEQEVKALKAGMPPATQPAAEVMIFGNVPRPGVYPHSRIRTVKRLLLAAGKDSIDDHEERVYLWHKADDAVWLLILKPNGILDGSVPDIDLAPDDKMMVENIRKALTRTPATQPAGKTRENANLRKKLISWVEKFFSQNYRDVKNRETIEWGQPKKLADGNYSIRYKFKCRIWGKERMIGNEIFTFTPTGKFVSARKVKGYPQFPDRKTPTTKPAGESKEKKEAKTLTCRGKVVDAEGKPLAGATVRAYKVDYLPGAGPRFVLFGQATTKTEGAFSFTNADSGSLHSEMMVVARQEGLALGWANPRVREGKLPEITLTLGKPATLAGRIVDESGAPVAGAEVRAML